MRIKIDEIKDLNNKVLSIESMFEQLDRYVNIFQGYLSFQGHTARNATQHEMRVVRNALVTDHVQTMNTLLGDMNQHIDVSDARERLTNIYTEFVRKEKTENES